jgi:hypothetical protein
MSDLPATLAKPAQRALANAGISSLEQLSRFTEAEIARLHGMGPNAMEKLSEAMKLSGIAFAPEEG